MVWGSMSAKGLGQICFIESTANTSQYINILENYLAPSVPISVTFNEYVFQQDRDLVHAPKNGFRITTSMF